jgi:hypothetical protein
MSGFLPWAGQSFLSDKLSDFSGLRKRFFSERVSLSGPCDVFL